MSKRKHHSVVFSRRDAPQSKELKEQSAIATRNDYVTGEGNEKSHRPPTADRDAGRLCDGTGVCSHKHLVERVVICRRASGA